VDQLASYLSHELGTQTPADRIADAIRKFEKEAGA